QHIPSKNIAINDASSSSLSVLASFLNQTRGILPRLLLRRWVETDSVEWDPSDEVSKLEVGLVVCADFCKAIGEIAFAFIIFISSSLMI
ncbi:hypothetical protein Tco_0162704, partial [Tanacetum coccineum]